MMPKMHDDFVAWYKTQKDITDWNFKEELIKYCRADVELLSKAVLKFRQLFYEKLETDPFRYTTLPSLCMSIYKCKFMPENTIVGNSNSKQDSITCREWLSHLNNPKIQREVPIKFQDIQTKRTILKDKPPLDLTTTAPYDKMIFDYYDASSNSEILIAGIVQRLEEQNFSNSDISRLIKAAATYTGQLCVKNNFYTMY